MAPWALRQCGARRRPARDVEHALLEAVDAVLDVPGVRVDGRLKKPSDKNGKAQI